MVHIKPRLLGTSCAILAPTTLPTPFPSLLNRLSFAWVGHPRDYGFGGEEHAPHRLRRARRDAARDLLSVHSKLVQVLYPRRAGSAREVLRCVAVPVEPKQRVTSGGICYNTFSGITCFVATICHVTLLKIVTGNCSATIYILIPQRHLGASALLEIKTQCIRRHLRQQHCSTSLSGEVAHGDGVSSPASRPSITHHIHIIWLAL
ncbi:hypothetical protein JB92DRAFT_2836423 [Gautieria morchelliformis]|nr:hypothetical protein JB92DRAFT_2836423 [Gautieria morchelliformis]